MEIIIPNEGLHGQHVKAALFNSNQRQVVVNGSDWRGGARLYVYRKQTYFSWLRHGHKPTQTKVSILNLCKPN